MELVYLWVEDYKNIKKQGFNFSPRFRCEYDEEKKELEIIDKDETDEFYPKNFFGDNINITAIVGENGSGKTNVLEAFLYTLALNISEDIKIKSIFFHEVDNCLYVKELGSSLPLNTKLKINNLSDDTNDCFTYYFNYSIDSLKNHSNIDFNKFYHRTNDFKEPLLLLPDKYKGNIDISNSEFLIKNNIFKFILQEKESFKFIEKIYVPIKFILKINTSRIIDDIRNPIADYLYSIMNNNNIDEKEKLIKCTYIYILNKIEKIGFIKDKEREFNFLKDEKLKNIFTNNRLSSKIEKFMELIEDKKFEIIIDNQSLMYKYTKLEQSFKFIHYLKTCESINFNIFSEKNDINVFSELLVNLAPWITVEMYDNKDISYEILSYGEKTILKFIYSLLNHLHYFHGLNKYKNIVLLLDEIELGLHPDWQRQFLKLLTDVLKVKSDFNFKIICATHSPFILSDLPKENVIFLEKGKQVYPFEDNRQTFGANIHTLLSHGFFMKDGLLGEFAKDKINEVIKYLNNESSTEIKTNDEAQGIINIIGEPIIKRELQRKLDSKRLSKIDKIDEIEKQMKIMEEHRKLLEHRLESIRKNQR